MNRRCMEAAKSCEHQYPPDFKYAIELTELMSLPFELIRTIPLVRSH